MPKQDRSALYTLFASGQRLLATSFRDLLDSFVHKDEQQAMNAQAINTRLASYDNDLKALSQSGSTATSVGDVLAALQGFPKNTTVLAAIQGGQVAPPNWVTLGGKPASLALRWTEQIITTNSITITTAQAWLAQTIVGGAGSTYLLMDIYVERRLSQTGPGQPILITDGITKLKLAVNPNISLS
jgi:hypothetical protein